MSNSIEDVIKEVLEKSEDALRAEQVSKKIPDYGFNAITRHLRIMTERGELKRKERKVEGVVHPIYYYSINKEGATK